jgi:hypothetical protein
MYERSAVMSNNEMLDVEVADDFLETGQRPVQVVMADTVRFSLASEDARTLAELLREGADVADLLERNAQDRS